MKTQHLIAAIVVGIASFCFGGLWSYLDVYFLSPPNWKFGRDADFQLRVFVSAWVAVCVAISFLATAPLYLRLFRARGRRHLTVYSAAFVVALSLLWWSGVFVYVYQFIGVYVIPSFSGNGLPEIVVSFFGASLLSATGFCCAAFVAERPFRAFSGNVRGLGVS